MLENLGGSFLWGKEHRWGVEGKNTARRKEKGVLKSFRLKKKVAQGFFLLLLFGSCLQLDVLTSAVDLNN